MIELTVIGGYLGSGKTTLINEILDRTDGERVAVVVNDFGTVNIDAEILGSRSGRTWEIANGCICCDLSDGMAAAIEGIRHATPPVSRVFVEVSGVGKPDIVARWGDHPGFVRGGSLVCADATSIRRDVKRKWVGETMLSQLRGADRLLLTKTDLVDDQTLREVEDWLVSTLGAEADIIERQQILDSGQGIPLSAPAAVAEAAGSGSAADSDLAADSDPAERTHSSWTITTASAVDPEHLKALVLRLPETIVRSKGILTDSRRPGRRFLIQYDGTRCDIDECESRSTDPEADGRLVIISAGDCAGTPEPVTALAQALHGRIGD